MKTLDFTAIDFETASGRRTSACSVGLVYVEGGRITGTDHYLIRPYPEYFSASNIAVHGITASDVRDAPTFAELWPDICGKLAGKTVAAHWTSFDMSVLQNTLNHYGIPVPDMDVICSCLMARAAYPQLPRHSLDAVCDHLGIPLDHHKADSDAQGSASIILRISEDEDIRSLDDVRERLGVIPGSFRDNAYVSVKGPGPRRRRR